MSFSLNHPGLWIRQPNSEPKRSAHFGTGNNQWWPRVAKENDFILQSHSPLRQQLLLACEQCHQQAEHLCNICLFFLDDSL
jgi:hypothetical protein